MIVVSPTTKARGLIGDTSLPDSAVEWLNKTGWFTSLAVVCCGS
jgi:hypothetical protein